ncbi:MAG: GAF domain-containing protein [Leptolyngbya sp. UWPOB_LEPTO1]|uniref:MHYT domain-containing protein n=1 Tax=Leptolyngbya sp. UWPOB_LEPTO1 TaxID=2815653 RepID=UPI001ACE6DD1|nr:MHYT domain-containing protein [Leptolyngbya sp. UWPOB_LEPTO1]MBN8563841.1 GAF domain-containing protein [Leptolyngbya sp. UWPOB_LEPTO1]
MASLTTGYNLQLVLVSVLIAVLASYSAIDLAGRVTATQSRVQKIWLFSGAASMGIGIWSMHFIGMLAFRLPVLVNYDFLTVLVSIAPAMIASGLALFLVSRPTLGWSQLLGGSICMGLGIASMHYIGMLSMHASAVIHYDVRVVALSVLIAIAVSFAGLFLVFQLREETTSRQLWKKLLASLIMGIAIPTMHYTGMAAACFMPMSNMLAESSLQPPKNVVPLAAAVIVGTLIILGLALLAAFFDRRLSAQIIYAQAIQESQQYLKTILQGIQVGVLVVEEDAQIQLSNRAVLDLLHFSSEADLQKLWNQGITSCLDSTLLEDSENPLLHSMQPVLQNILAKQPVQNAVIYVEAEEQEPTALLVNAVPLKLSNAAVTQMVCTFNEITELKRTENRLKESEAKFRDLATQEELLNQLSSQIRESLDLPTILQTAVSEVRKLFAVDRALIYQFNADWRGQVSLEDVAEPWSPTLGEAADNCAPGECFEKYRQGQIRAINNVLEAGLDPTHLQFLQRLQVQANLIVPIMVGDQLWGLLIVHQCSHPRVWKEEEGNLLYRLAGQLGIAIQQGDLYARMENTALQAQAQAEQLLESEVRLTQQTRTLQKTLEELQSVQLQLVQSEKMSGLGQLVAGVAHEINNPVNFIHANLNHLQTYAWDLLDFVQLYRKYYPDAMPEIEAKAEEIDLEFLQEDLMKLLTSMKTGTDRIRQIVLSLRNFSRMDESEFKAVDIHEGIESTLMILQHRLKGSKNRPAIGVIREYDNLPIVECYPGQLNQVLMNLLSNAIDSLEDQNEKRTLQDIKDHPSQITLRTSSIDAQWIEIEVVDNGAGIPEEVKERIFDPFFTTKPVGKGTGMGLSLSYKIIVEQHGGKLECYSQPNQGAQFVIRIPIKQ